MFEVSKPWVNWAAFRPYVLNKWLREVAKLGLKGRGSCIRRIFYLNVGLNGVD